MAKKKNQDEDPEEDKRDQFDDDEDFGLPDLEYDQLDDDFEDEMDIPSEMEPEINKVNVKSEDIGDSKESSFSGDPFASTKPSTDSEDLGGLDLEHMDLDDIDIDDIEISDEELQKELDSIDKEGTGDKGAKSAPSYYEAESFEEFKDESAGSVFAADKTSTSKTESKAASGYTKKVDNTYPQSKSGQVTYERSGSNSFVKIVIIGVILFTVVAVVLYAWLGSEPEPELVKTEVVAEPVAEPVVDTPTEDEKAASAAGKAILTPPGTITTLTERTGNSYIIVSSFFDEDLAKDHSDKIAATGKSPVIIPPFGTSRFYRVGIAGYQTVADAQSYIPQFQAEFGNDIWILKY